MNTFPYRFKKLREASGLTQEVVAEKLGVQRPTIAGYESLDKNRIPREETLNKIADLFNTSIDYLMGRTDDPTPSQHSAPEWATSRDKRDIKRILEDDLPVMFDGMPVDEEDKQRITDLITGFLWEAKEKNKVTYGRKKKVETDPGDNEVK